MGVVSGSHRPPRPLSAGMDQQDLTSLLRMEEGRDEDPLELEGEEEEEDEEEEEEEEGEEEEEEDDEEDEGEEEEADAERWPGEPAKSGKDSEDTVSYLPLRQASSTEEGAEAEPTLRRSESSFWTWFSPLSLLSGLGAASDRKRSPPGSELCSLEKPRPPGRICPRCEILFCRKCETLHSDPAYVDHCVLAHGEAELDVPSSRASAAESQTAEWPGLGGNESP
ncbi:uncharacterized protein C17orf50 homolog isoform X2 [Tachyglossus aculeatus]|uniref:uncharacterized protein C17orf50 homolog isoform X2 n=1 Tax=Tachyglossus aculeatus TaxID=9261 RepID=UPI0018F645A2|nr:uncharacterized protein C17orf50 homolog isoform X2 [Tachyglossus aculeatus]